MLDLLEASFPALGRSGERPTFFQRNKPPPCLGSWESIHRLASDPNGFFCCDTSFGPSCGFLMINVFHLENCLSKLPMTLPSCIHLQYLNVANNRLTEVPIWFYRFRTLTVLDLVPPLPYLDSLSRLWF